MGLTETVTATEAASAAGAPSHLDEQIANLEGHLQDLLREGRAEPSARKAPSPQTEPLTQPKLAAEAKPSPTPTLPPLAPPAAAPRSQARRLARLAVGVGLLALAAWALAPLIFELRSTSARVNAPILTLRSPIDGTVKFGCPTTSGAAATAGAPLFEIKNSLADEDRVDSLKDEEAYLQSRISGARRQLTGLAALQEGLSSTAGEYRDARLRLLQMDCEAARAALENARAVKKQRDFEEQQLARLESSRTISKQDASAAHFADDAAGHAVVQAEKNVEKLQEQVRCLRAGVQAGDGGDLPYTTQRLHDLGCRIEETRATLWQDEAKLAQLQRHIRAETERQSRRARFASVAPEQSVVWRRRVGNNTPTQADSPLLDLVNPSEVFIDAVISESDLKRVQCGGSARVRLPGSRKEWKAVVKQVFGHDLPWPDASLAASAVPATQQEIHVILGFTEPLTDGGSAVSFPVGLPAEVTFVSTGDALKRLITH
jgi:hypothetical protein